MTKHELGAGAAALISNEQIPFERRGFTAKQTQALLAIKKTKFFDILPQLEHYLDGNRIIVIGRSITAYQDRKLAEARQPRPMPEHHEKRRRRRETGAP